MTTWKDGGNYGLLCREITDEAGDRAIAKVWTKQLSGRFRDTEPWPEGEANFDLILNAPQMMAALEAIAELDPAYWCQTEPDNAVCDQCKEIARTAIAAVKGEDDDR